ncbi:chlorophyll synthesis pathway protein BchC [Cereibacter johrii]|uniref:2-desacetyl-2-hydroxyethyl bacteriochlorophyllide A dehydrogenase n=1 Tax=Cereibacter johrii TaxID=445629 RepID=A0ABX5JBE8_9RHOB|nr:chlorophyll synthesis pathway protein BchC [Cereibacter johrii]EKX56387.1 2-desacetyl-2-hydroxyethyl bacteriochlorophyllide A dehydrogenase BchC [Rhodobacter sp. AKP1]RDS94546.1 chlorophyll synthesis pathway protein BchC [Cereibacter sphaeroides f. sp. denitrificans]MEA5161046.1 chlorophyll synthesis pathway protein BchC [Cereibacter johrii]ODM41925.1 chlorophyll synthesis pathway protein BchC [Cereibacter johrii]PTM80510.1 2-desacetyl-2-hydroxyethyl bacteriochlorophyllide A dehydrogenase [
MRTTAVILSGPRDLGLQTIQLNEPAPGDIVVEITHSGISTGTEKLFYTGQMPPFPGMGYPLVPGYEAAGEVVEAAPDTGFRPGDRVFVPGSNCFAPTDAGPIRGLFGAATKRLVTPAHRAVRIDPALEAEGALLALAATARHALAGLNHVLPDLIVGHGTLGRLLARLTIAAGGEPPVVWETKAERRRHAQGYEVIDPATDQRRDYRSIYDASGDPKLIDSLVMRLAKGGEIVLAGFYTEPVAFTFVPAFMKEARLRIAAEWQPEDMVATRALIESGALSLANLITHTRPASEAAEAYATAFSDPDCLKMILDWRATA